MRNNRNIKIGMMIMIIIMEKQAVDKKVFHIQNKSYFNSETQKNLEKTDVKKLLFKMILGILNKISSF